MMLRDQYGLKIKELILNTIYGQLVTLKSIFFNFKSYLVANSI